MKLNKIIVFAITILPSLLWCLTPEESKPEATKPEVEKSVYAKLGLAFEGRIGSATLEDRIAVLVKPGKAPITTKESDPTKKEPSAETDAAAKQAEAEIAFTHLRKLYGLFEKNDTDREKMSADKPHAKPHDPLHIDAWKDLRLVYGDKNAPLSTLTTKLSHPLTKMGVVFSEKFLISPTDDIATLQNRQQLLRRLVEDDALYTAVKNSLGTVAANEDNLLGMWQINPNDDWKNLLSDGIGLYWDPQRKPEKLRSWNLLEQLNYGSWRKIIDRHPWLSTGGLVLTSYFLISELYRYISYDAESINSIFSNTLTGPFKKLFDKATGAKQPKSSEESREKPGTVLDPERAFSRNCRLLRASLVTMKKVPARTPEATRTFLSNLTEVAKSAEAITINTSVPPAEQNSVAGKIRGAGNKLVDLLFSRGYQFLVADSVNQFKEHASYRNLLSLPKYFCAMMYLVFTPVSALYFPLYFWNYLDWRFFDKYKAIKRAYGEVNSIEALLKASTDITSSLHTTNDNCRALALLPELEHLNIGGLDKEFATLTQQLKSPVRNPGTLLAVYKRIFDLKDKFTTALEAIGEVDTYVAMATTIREHRALKNGYCFPSFETSTTAHIAMTNVWNPLTAANEAIGNSIELGGQCRARNAIITGPNAGGKSTFLRTVLTAALLGQTFGIMPAQAASFTPFSYLDSYMNIEDNPADKKSLFRMQGNRMTSILNAVKKLTPDQHALVVVDEMFSGTNPTDASRIGLATAVHRLANFTNSIWLIATHHIELARAERDTDGVFTNLKVNVNRDTNGKFLGYPFTITPGISTESTACDVLEMEGFDPEILKFASVRTHS